MRAHLLLPFFVDAREFVQLLAGSFTPIWKIIMNRTPVPTTINTICWKKKKNETKRLSIVTAQPFRPPERLNRSLVNYKLDFKSFHKKNLFFVCFFLFSLFSSMSVSSKLTGNSRNSCDKTEIIPAITPQHEAMTHCVI